MTDIIKEPWGYVVFVKEIIDGSGYTCPHTGEEILDQTKNGLPVPQKRKR